jgi:hypothetical protein
MASKWSSEMQNLSLKYKHSQADAISSSPFSHEIFNELGWSAFEGVKFKDEDQAAICFGWKLQFFHKVEFWLFDVPAQLSRDIFVEHQRIEVFE